MALESLGSLRDIVVRIRGQGEALKQSLAQAQSGVNRLRVSMGGFNVAGLGAIRIYRTLGIGLAALGAVVGVSTLLRQMQSMVAAGAQFNAQIEQMTLGIKAVVAANVDVVAATGDQIGEAEKLRIVGVQVADQIERMKTDALVTTATLQQIVQAFQGAVPPAAAAGIKLDDIRKVTIAIVQAAGAIGLPLQQVAVETREILGGTINTHTRLAQSLRITNDMVRSWKEQGTLVQELLGRMSSFTIAGKEAGETFVGIVSTLQDFKEQLLGAAVGPAQELVRQLLVRLRDSLGEVRAGVFVFRQEIQTAFETMGTVLKAALELLLAVGGAVKDVASLLVTVLGPALPLLRGFVVILVDAFTSLLSVISGTARALQDLAGLLFTVLEPALALARRIGAPLVDAFAALRRVTGEAAVALEQVLQPMQDVQAAAQQQEQSLNRERESLEAAAAALAGDTATREQKREVIAQLARDYEDFLPFLLDENRATSEAVPLIKARVAALKEQAQEQRRIQIEQLRGQEEALQRELDLRRQRLEQGIDPAEQATRQLIALEQRLRDTAARRRTLEVEAVLVAKPLAETEAQRKAREKVELEGRKTALAALLQVEEDALVDLELGQAEFDLRQDTSAQERIDREEAFLRRKQEIERTKAAIVLDGLRTEARLIEEKVGKEKEAEAQLLAVKRDIAGKEADLANLVKRQRLEGLQAVRDKEKALQREREDETLGFLGRLRQRLERGPLDIALRGPGGRLFQTEAITAETELTPETVAAARRALEEEQGRRIQELQFGTGRGLRLEQFTELIESLRAQREGAEKLTQLGPFEEILGAALGGREAGIGGAFVQAQLTGFGAIEEKAGTTFTKVRELFAETNAKLIEDSRAFQAQFPEVLFDGFYRRLVERLGREFGRQ